MAATRRGGPASCPWTQCRRGRGTAIGSVGGGGGVWGACGRVESTAGDLHGRCAKKGWWWWRWRWRRSRCRQRRPTPYRGRGQRRGRSRRLVERGKRAFVGGAADASTGPGGVASRRGGSPTGGGRADGAAGRGGRRRTRRSPAAAAAVVAQPPGGPAPASSPPRSDCGDAGDGRGTVVGRRGAVRAGAPGCRTGSEAGTPVLFLLPPSPPTGRM
ncbi:hypothetical protein BU14_0076s0031 [Porphyra umbilicalis]|uniref:Uncharacterized protein n=1 Tax=Porphyra umbilicalis TaxID=2786 RepID=A0A1X6PFE9_PORUM|nr:hypothetical protein BU14_0076s0031 [Porphyra umbilicalis]|eukprot:OSX79475.1 hypothetical protein BU14_0076s0031 [Porphyra umbilicalis]